MASTVRTDHFLVNQAAVAELHKLLVNKETRLPAFKVKSGSELYRLLLKHNLALFQPIPKNTLVGWCDCPSGAFASRAWPVPRPVFTAGHERGFNARLRTSLGRPSLLAGCEPELEALKSRLMIYRDGGVCVNIPVARHMIVSILIQKGKGDQLSPHLLSVTAPVIQIRGA